MKKYCVTLTADERESLTRLGRPRRDTLVARHF